MSQQSGQDLQNHATFDPKLISAMLLGVIALIFVAISILADSILFLQVAVLDATVCVLLLCYTVRAYSTKLQDRIIRTEMKIRLRDVLDGERAAKAETLTIPQLVGLRFASDAELPALVAKVLDEDISSAGEIKKLVTDWQGDYHRV